MSELLQSDTVGKADRLQNASSRSNQPTSGELIIEIKVDDDYVEVNCLTPNKQKLYQHMTSIMSSALKDKNVYKALQASHQIISKILEFVEIIKRKEASHD
jgi:hypothetical protein